MSLRFLDSFLRKRWDRPVVQNAAKKGLFAGRHIQFGNKISFSLKKTRRTWKPNVQHHRYWSETLQKILRVKLTTAAMRWIDKVGGFDNYILTTPPKKLGPGFAQRLRQTMIAARDERLKQATNAGLQLTPTTSTAAATAAASPSAPAQSRSPPPQY